MNKLNLPTQLGLRDPWLTFASIKEPVICQGLVCFMNEGKIHIEIQKMNYANFEISTVSSSSQKATVKVSACNVFALFMKTLISALAHGRGNISLTCLIFTPKYVQTLKN